MPYVIPSTAASMGVRTDAADVHPAAAAAAGVARGIMRGGRDDQRTHGHHHHHHMSQQQQQQQGGGGHHHHGRGDSMGMRGGRGGSGMGGQGGYGGGGGVGGRSVPVSSSSDAQGSGTRSQVLEDYRNNKTREYELRVRIFYVCFVNHRPNIFLCVGYSGPCCRVQYGSARFPLHSAEA